MINSAMICSASWRHVSTLTARTGIWATNLPALPAASSEQRKRMRSSRDVCVCVCVCVWGKVHESSGFLAPHSDFFFAQRDLH